MGSICTHEPLTQTNNSEILFPVTNHSEQRQQDNLTQIEGIKNMNDPNVSGKGLQEGIIYRIVNSLKGLPTASFARPTKKHNDLTQQANLTLEYIKKGNLEGVSERIPDIDSQIYLVKSSSATYQGGFMKGLPEGTGVVHFKDGSYYFGDFVKGNANGNGIFIYPNGSVYDGGFKDSLFDGYGALIYMERKMRFIGEFKVGKPNGKGEQLYESGDIFIGQFEKGLKNGYGTYRWKSNKTFQGEFKNGEPNGLGKLRNKNFTIFEGQFLKGGKHGQGIFLSEQGSYEGNFQNDFLQGQGTLVWKDGKIYEGEFSKSKMNGKGRILYPSGQICEGVWHQNHNKSLTSIGNDTSIIAYMKQIIQRHRQQTNTIMDQDLQISQKINTSNNSYLQNNDQQSLLKIDSYRSNQLQGDSYKIKKNTVDFVKEKEVQN